MVDSLTDPNPNPENEGCIILIVLSVLIIIWLGGCFDGC